jgi:hypothetical protein
MNELQTQNIGQCLTLIKDFYEAVPSEEVDSELQVKRREAGKALDHLELLFDVKKLAIEGSCCTSGTQLASHSTSKMKCEQ